MNTKFAALAAGVSILLISTTAMATEGPPAEKPVKVIRSLGNGQVNKCGTPENQWTGSVQTAGLTPEQATELKTEIAANRGEATTVSKNDLLDIYLGCSKGHVKNVVPRGHQGILLDVPYVVTSRTYRLSDGRVIEIIDKCGNWIVRAHRPFVPPPQVTVKYTPPADQPMEPMMEEREVEVVEKSAEMLQWEAIMGVWVGQSGLANFKGAFGEATLYVPLGDGWKAGLGIFGMVGGGESRVSPYSWDEHRFGPQFALRHDYLRTKTSVDEFGQTITEQLPAGNGIKVRYLWDQVSGGNPESGYHQTQKGHGVNIYAEHVQRETANFLWGVTGEAFLYGGGSIKSTWSGDRPQNRSYYSINAFGQWVLDPKTRNWQLRAGAGLSHQAWDKVNYFSLRAELRYKEIIMCGPQFSLALNRPDSYKPYGRGKLDTLMGFCRLELGGEMRAWDQRRRRKQVQLVQVGMRPVTDSSAMEVINLPHRINPEASLDLPSVRLPQTQLQSHPINLNLEVGNDNEVAPDRNVAGQ